MNVTNRRRVLYAQPAVCGSEKVISAPIRQLDLSVLQNNGGVFGQKHGTVQKPIIARFIYLTRRYHHNSVRSSVLYGVVQYLAVICAGKIICYNHNYLPKGVEVLSYKIAKCSKSGLE
jgi:hypothetical protein